MSSMKQADAQPPKAELGQEVGAVESFRGSLNSWIMAYPEQCFSEPQPEELFWLRDAKPGLLDRISASMGRHVAKCLITDFDAAFANFTSPAHTSEARGAVSAELERAVRKFPTWPTDPLHAVAVLGEEFGELTKAVLQSVYEPHKVKPGEVRTEAVQTAAMALRFLQSLDAYVYSRSEQHSQDAAMRQEGG